ncbi:hypothetical protein DVDV_0139 [Desulfovibrio sp. DV]|uniref:hypothetical protein n=1 Tax=Desulfovibrio sp. DV TaxID=1844708 RepID=UPI00094B8FDD|nr:hypothetical protein [Desulfovibrio sp. DV]OLN31017.1 hypothetical protein DVDV_0139 [Desulfovibrio sp. DV]
MLSNAIRLIVLCALAAGFLLPAMGNTAESPVRGGPCRYDVFPGTAVFVSVAPWQPSSPTEGIPTPYPPLAVTYRFTPDTPIVGEPLYAPDKLFTLTLVNSMPPGPKFIAKYAIAPGKAVPCQVHIIRQGTCTPVVHVFPGIDLTDYFELTGR